jgi:hypothetical protein
MFKYDHLGVVFMGLAKDFQLHILTGGEISNLEEPALIFSGCDTQEKLDDYVGRLDAVVTSAQTFRDKFLSRSLDWHESRYDKLLGEWQAYLVGLRRVSMAQAVAEVKNCKQGVDNILSSMRSWDDSTKSAYALFNFSWMGRLNALTHEVGVTEMIDSYLDTSKIGVPPKETLMMFYAVLAERKGLHLKFSSFNKMPYLVLNSTVSAKNILFNSPFDFDIELGGEDLFGELGDSVSDTNTVDIMADLCTRLARHHGYNGDTAEAVKQASLAVALCPTNIDALMLKADCLIDAAEYNQALDILDRVEGEMGDCAEVYLLKSITYLCAGDTGESGKMLSKAETLIMDEKDVFTDEEETDSGISDDVIQDSGINNDIVLLSFTKSLHEIHRRDYAAAAEEFSRTIAMAHPCTDYFFFRGFCYEQLGEENPLYLEAALDDYAAIAAIDKHSADYAQTCKARVLLKQGKTAEALVEAEFALSGNQQIPELRRVHRDCLANLGQDCLITLGLDGAMESEDNVYADLLKQSETIEGIRPNILALLNKGKTVWDF